MLRRGAKRKKRYKQFTKRIFTNKKKKKKEGRGVKAKNNDELLGPPSSERRPRLDLLH
jgi:hypothetical protein